MNVYVHIWDDNANVYGSHNAALAGISESCEDEGTIDDLLYAAENEPGEPVYIDDGMSTLRYLSITERTD